MARKIATRKKDVVRAMEECMGIVTTALSKIPDVDRGTFYRWLKKDEKFKAEIDAINERQIDFAESALYKNIRDGDTASIIFFLKTKGKNRGYTQTVEVNATVEHKPIDGMQIEVVERKKLQKKNIIDI